MEKPIDVLLMPDAQKFIDNLDDEARKKVFFNIRKTLQGIRGEWFEKMKGTDHLYEFRTLYNRQYIRLFAFWDNRNDKKSLIICTNGFLKKSAQTPDTVLEKAEKSRKLYLGL